MEENVDFVEKEKQLLEELKKLKKLKFEQDKEAETKSDLLTKLIDENKVLKAKNDKLTQEEAE